MSVVARFTVPADEFPLGSLLEVRHGITVRLESMIPTGDAPIPYFWVSVEDEDAVAAALRDSPLVDAARVVDRTDDEALFRVEWAGAVDGVVDAVADSEGALLEAEGQGDTWSFRARFPSREDLSAFYHACVDDDIPVDLAEVNRPMSAGATDRPALTSAQREALHASFEAGYFDVPRRITLVELAERLDISDTALSQRIRRGLTTLLASTLADVGVERPDE